MNTKTSSLYCACLGTLIPFSPNTFANTTVEQTSSVSESAIESIEVIGDFRQQTINKVPASLSILTEQQFSARNAQNLEEIIAATANVNFASGSSRARFFQVRGIGERSQFKEPVNASVGVIIDHVDFSGIAGVASLFDVKQVEVYRGPQGTRFGASAMAGMVNIHSHDPTDDFEGQVKSMLGNYNSQSLGLTLSGPIDQGLAYRFALERFVSDGFNQNTFLNKKDTNNKDELTVRSKLVYQPSDKLTLDMALFYIDFDNGYDAFSLDNNRTTFSDQPGFDHNKTLATSIKATYKGMKGANLIAIASYVDADLDYGYDEDWTFVDFHPWGYSSTDHYFRTKKNHAIDLRLVSKPEGKWFNNSTAWVLGAYFKDSVDDLRRQYTYEESDFGSSFQSQNLATYVQLDSDLTAKLGLSTGLRIEQRQANYQDTNALSFKPDETMVGGQIALAYQLAHNTNVYASINRGFKAGGVNTDGSLPDTNRAFDSEYLINYELGVKQSLLAGNATMRMAVFYMDRKDMQVKTYNAIERSDGSQEFVVYIDNAAKGSNQGIEVESTWHLTNNLELYGSVGLLKSKYIDFINGNGEDYSGREQAHAPSYMYNMGINYYLTSQWLINVAMDAKDGFYFSDSHQQKSKPVEIYHASLAYVQDDWQIKLWGKNITDNDYATRGYYFGNDPRIGYDSQNYIQLGAPAEYGLTFNLNF
ncbi:TonB-dependent receptor [Thalassotalea aquiviva]|uniref:TonB-dependent receptor n=1 Tax=Thalassotalea aquiviva TaxID=3242415 RepID=UPI00352A5C60